MDFKNNIFSHFNDRPRSNSTNIAIGIAILMLTFQITPLFWSKPFYFDWLNHVWLVEYYTHYFKKHFQFPSTIDVTQEFGSALPIFYGVFFYPVVSILALAMDADTAMRVFCASLLIIPTITYTILFFKITKDRSISILLSVTVNCSVYQITNLYSRGALTEFASDQFLIIAFSIIAYGILSKSKLKHFLATLSLGFSFLTLSMGTHPITFLLFTILNFPIIFYGILIFKRAGINTRSISIMSWGLCTTLVLLPWVVATLKYRHYLYIQTVTKSTDGKLIYFPLSIDSLWGKLGLFFVDPRVLNQGIGAVATPFLESPYSISLVLVVAGIFFHLRKVDWRAFIEILVPTALTTIFIIFMGHTPTVAEHSTAPDFMVFDSRGGMLHKLLSMAQFAYRMTNPFAICLILALIFGLVAFSKSGDFQKSKKAINLLTLVAALIGCLGLGQKLFETYIEFVEYPSWKTLQGDSMQFNDSILLMKWNDYTSMVHDINRYPSSFYAAGNYGMMKLIPPISDFDTQNRQIFTTVFSRWNSDVTITCTKPCLITTNVSPSVFSQLQLDNQTPKNLAYSSELKTMVLAEPGSHTLRMIKVGWAPKLIAASIWITLAWFFFSLLAFIFLRKYAQPNLNFD